MSLAANDGISHVRIAPPATRVGKFPPKPFAIGNCEKTVHAFILRVSYKKDLQDIRDVRMPEN